MLQTRKLRVFLCHASQDKTAARELYKRLKAEPWINPWLDEEKLLAGQDWDLEIYKTLREADAIIVCLSKESIAKEGYVQKEFKRALNFAGEKPEGTIYIIPLRLDDCQPPLKFQQWQWVDGFKTGATQKLMQSLHLRAKTLGILPVTRPVPVRPAPSSGKVASPAIVVPAPPVAQVKSTPGGIPIYVFGGLEFVRVPGGDFYMGADDLGDDSKPQHLVYQLTHDFYIGRFPVTNQEYSISARETGQPVIMSKGKGRHPVVNVSWQDAQKYIEWLNKKYQSELPNGYRFCLPSEAEWEKVARGMEGNEYPWGDTFDESKCNTVEGGKYDTTPVGVYSPQGDSPYGAADMVGNVWEWTRSLWGKDASSPSFKYPYRFDDGREDEGAQNDMCRVVRGGAFGDSVRYVRCASRNWSNPDLWLRYQGFRVVVSPVLNSEL